MVKIKPDSIRKAYIFGVLIGIIFFIISVLNPWLTWAHKKEFYLHTSTTQEHIYGFIALIYGGWLSLLFIIISLGYIYGLKIWKAIVTNCISCILFLVNLFLWPTVGPTLAPDYARSITLSIGYYLGIVSVVIFSLALLFLIENRKSLQIEKKVISETKDVLENIEKEKLYCPSCGAGITDSTSTFCNKCGSPLK